MDTQLKRGILDILVLSVLRKKDSYGYQIIKDVSPAMEISESTLYPILKRLENNNCLTFYTVEHNGRLRKYYKITNTGINKIYDFLNKWKDMMKIYNFINGVNNE